MIVLKICSPCAYRIRFLTISCCRIRDDLKKEDAFRGLCAMVRLLCVGSLQRIKPESELLHLWIWASLSVMFEILILSLNLRWVFEPSWYWPSTSLNLLFGLIGTVESRRCRKLISSNVWSHWKLACKFFLTDGIYTVRQEFLSCQSVNKGCGEIYGQSCCQCCVRLWWRCFSWYGSQWDFFLKAYFSVLLRPMQCNCEWIMQLIYSFLFFSIQEIRNKELSVEIAHVLRGYKQVFFYILLALWLTRGAILVVLRISLNLLLWVKLVLSRIILCSTFWHMFILDTSNMVKLAYMCILFEISIMKDHCVADAFSIQLVGTVFWSSGWKITREPGKNIRALRFATSYIGNIPLCSCSKR